MKAKIVVNTTPDPNSLKFITDQILNSSDSPLTYIASGDQGNGTLSKNLLKIDGVDRISFKNRYVTITKAHHAEWDVLHPIIIEAIEKNLKDHHPDRENERPEKQEASSELAKIEEIIDREIRPFLNNDGGDITIISYEDNVLKIQYQGACGSCHSATRGTLAAIRTILKQEFNPEIEIYIASE